MNEVTVYDNKVTLRTEGAEMRRANLRIKLPFVPEKATINGKEADISYDTLSRTALITFCNVTGERKIIIE